MPRQRVLRNQKTKEWFEQCTNACIGLINTYNNNRRPTFKNKKSNYLLVNGQFDKNDFKHVLNPLGLEEFELPAEMRDHDIISPIIKLLKGEEAKRVFDYVVRATSPDIITEIESGQRQVIFDFIKESVLGTDQDQQQATNQQELQAKQQDGLKKLEEYLNYTYKDIREIMASRTLDYLRKELDVDRLLLEGWEDALIAGEELFRIDIIGGEPVMIRCNPLETYYLLPHNKYDIDDAEVIIEETWMSPGRIIDNYYDLLSTEQMDEMEKQFPMLSKDGLGYAEPVRLFVESVDSIDNTGYIFNKVNDDIGNIRVVRCIWKGRRKLGILTKIDDNGQTYEELVDETYPATKDDQIEWKWINEYNQCTKIGRDIFVDYGACKVQRRKMDNISQVKSPYVGTLYDANNAHAVSLVDRLKAHQYLYNVIWYRTELALANSYGKIMEFDLASIPREYGFDMDKWLYYLRAMNIAFTNSFEESKKGERVGQMSGVQATREINLEQGQYINQHIELLRFIEDKVADLSGVTKQRQGEIQTKELVGNVERSVQQSNSMTEPMFTTHHHVRKRVYEALIEVGKVAWRNKSKKVPYILDDLSTRFIEIDGAEFDNGEYGVFVSNTTSDNLALNQLKNLAQAALQNGTIGLTQIIDILSCESYSLMRRKIEKYEKERQQVAQQQAEADGKAQQAMLDDKKQERKESLEAKERMNTQDNDTKIEVALIEKEAELELIELQNGIMPAVDTAKLDVQREIAELKKQVDEKKVDSKDKQDDRKSDQKDREIAIKDKIANKPKPATAR